MLVWLILGTVEDADSCGTVDPEAELLPAGRFVVPPPLGVEVKGVEVGGAPDAERQEELGGIDAEFPDILCSWLEGDGAVWCFGGVSRLLSSCKVAK